MPAGEGDPAVADRPVPATPDVTVVMPACNPGPFLRESVESVMGQSYGAWHLLIVDDGSTQDLSVYLPCTLDRRRLTIVRHAVNRGQSAALNTALRHVQTPYFLQLDPDDLLLPEAVELLRNALAACPPTTALVSANIRVIYADDEEPPVVRVGAPFRRGDRYRLLLHNKAVWPRFYRTEALRRVGGWPTNGPYEGRYLEDRRMMYRLIEAHSLAWINQVVYIYRRHGGNITVLHAREHNELVRYVVGECLRRWGGRFRPVFRRAEGSLLLVALRPAGLGRKSRRRRLSL